MSRNDLNAAQAAFEKIVRLAPSAEQRHSALGAVLVRLGRTTEGILKLGKALTIQPSDSSAQLNLALAYGQLLFSTSIPAEQGFAGPIRSPM